MSHSSTLRQPVGNTGQLAAERDFWLFFSSGESNVGVNDALHALYYLPANYKLIVLSDALSRDNVSVTKDSIGDRIRIQDSTGLPNEASPFSYADAIIYEGEEPAGAGQVPAVIVRMKGGTAIERNTHNGFTITAGNPEALATAVLRIARAA